MYSVEKPLSRWADNILQNYSADRHYQLNASLMESLSDKEATSELIALVKMPADDPARIKFNSIPLVLLLDRPANPGNIGTIIRSCDSFKADGLIITGHAADLYDPQTIRASVGTIFSLPVIRMASHNDLLAWVEQLKSDWKDIQIIGSSAKAERLLFDADLKRPLIYLLGNETKGLSENFKKSCDFLVRIPIQGTASSLNLASAAAISLYEIFKQRNNLP
jgi:TrmH family RNA methyltransferase